jgi:hypothetical protein
MAYITRNDMLGYNTGIRIAPLNDISGGPSSMWRVVDNIASNASQAVDKSLKIGIANNVSDSGNKT